MYWSVTSPSNSGFPPSRPSSTCSRLIARIDIAMLGKIIYILKSKWDLRIFWIPRLEVGPCAERPIEVPIVDRHCKQVGWSSKILKYKGRCKRFSQLVQVIVVSPSVKGHLHPIEFLLLVFLLRWISKVEDETFTALHWAFFFFFPLQE